MPASYSDYLFLPGGGARVGAWVQLTNNESLTNYRSDSATDGNGMFTMTPEPTPGQYTVKIAATSLPLGDAGWVATGNTKYIVPYTAGDDMVMHSGTSKPTSPNTQTAVTGGGDFTGAVRMAGGDPWYDASHPTYAGGAKFDGVTDDTAALTAFITAANATNGLYRMPSGSTVVSSTLPTWTNYRASLVGPGREECLIKYTGSGDCLRIQPNPWPGNPATPGIWGTGPKVTGFTIDGTGAAAGAVGLHYGDIISGEVDVAIQHFNGAGSIGLLLNNDTHWTERNRIKATLSDNTIGVALTVTGTGTVSFGYNEFDLQMSIQSGQAGFQHIGTGQFYSGRFFAMANCASNGTVLDMSSGTAQVVDALVDIRAEQSGTGSVFANIAAGATWRTYGPLIPFTLTTIGTMSGFSFVANGQPGGGFNGTGGVVQIGGTTSSLALTVAATGANYGLQVDESTASAVTGLKIKAQGAGAGLDLSTIGGNAAEDVRLNAKGAGAIALGSSSTGAITLGSAQANYLQAQAAGTGSNPSLSAIGSDTDITLALTGKGARGIALDSGKFNWVSLIGNSAGNGPQLAAVGGDTNIALNLTGKGSRGVALDVGKTNWLTVLGGAGGVRADLGANGGDTDIDLGLSPKGAGVVYFNYAATALGGGATATLGTIGGSGPATAAQHGWLKFKIAGTASFVSEWR